MHPFGVRPLPRTILFHCLSIEAAVESRDRNSNKKTCFLCRACFQYARRNHNMKLRRFLIIASFSILAYNAFAQTDRGTITGTVSDATAAVIPGVAIEAKNVQTGAVYQAGSSETGNYTLAQLPAGTYELTATRPGFRRFVRTRRILTRATCRRS